ncbi:TM0106 family RecB-like putative nuclease [Williamsia sp. MIQD14]|uniref:TM0106 family RecB-like putative nuclease n=1 Tax=Williamsia sp. MIQD14 TaxID=3425703 RepID=UPI003DA033E9
MDETVAPRRPRRLLSARDLSGCDHRLALDSGVVPDTLAGVESAPADDAVVLTDSPAAEDPSVTRRKEAATAHRETVAEMLEGLHSDEPDAVVRIDGDNAGDRVAATMAACAAGVAWIWNAALPADTDAGIRGGSELLVRVADGYVPVIVVNHRVTVPGAPAGKTTPGSGDTPAAPPSTSPLWTWAPVPDPTRAIRRHRRDLLRLAHLTRLLAHAGVASTSAVGGSIGLDADCIVVHDLTETLAGYDDLLARRSAIAAGELTTGPSRVGECRTCPWWVRCEPELAATRDVSLVVNGAQVGALRTAGVLTIDDLAAFDGPVPTDWPGRADLADAVTSARAWLAGVPLIRRTEQPVVARADVEVDVDMESYGEDGAYLWGTLLTDRTDAAREVLYRPFVTWDPLPTDDEARSFAEFWAWLMGERAAAHEAGHTFAAYCYSQAAENRWLLGSARRFAGRPGVPAIGEIEQFIGSPEWVDVYEAVGANFVCPHGKGLKKIAPVAGFSWRDPEAGGEASMDWYRVAVGRDEPASPDPDGTAEGQRARLLRYNEDDVWATKVLREWIDTAAKDVIPHRSDL